MSIAAADPATLSFRSQIAFARGVNALLIARIMRGDRIYNHGTDITDDCLASARRKHGLADAILNAPPLDSSTMEAILSAPTIVMADFDNEADGILG